MLVNIYMNVALMDSVRIYAICMFSQSVRNRGTKHMYSLVLQNRTQFHFVLVALVGLRWTWSARPRPLVYVIILCLFSPVMMCFYFSVWILMLALVIINGRRWEQGCQSAHRPKIQICGEALMHMLLMCHCVEPARKTTTERTESVLVHSKTDTLLISLYAKMFQLMATAERAHVYIPFHVEKYGRVHSLRTRVLIIRFCRSSEIT